EIDDIEAILCVDRDRPGLDELAGLRAESAPNNLRIGAWSATAGLGYENNEDRPEKKNRATASLKGRAIKAHTDLETSAHRQCSCLSAYRLLRRTLCILSKVSRRQTRGQLPNVRCERCIESIMD